MSPQNYTFMFYGFTVAWLIIIVYVISIALREKRLREELDRVKKMVEEGEGTAAIAQLLHEYHNALQQQVRDMGFEGLNSSIFDPDSPLI